MIDRQHMIDDRHGGLAIPSKDRRGIETRAATDDDR
jgi:hypothetical protein